MAKVLPFPAPQRAGAAQRAHVPPPCDGAQRVSVDAEDTWSEDDAEDGVSLETVARLADAPSPTLDALAEKLEVLVTRLAPDDGDDAGLCAAEIRLLRSVLQDLRVFAADLVFAVQGAGRIERGTA